MTKNAIENTEEIVLGEFDFESFSKKSLQNRKKSSEYQQMLNMYNINEILSPEKGNIVSVQNMWVNPKGNLSSMLKDIKMMLE